MVWGTPSRLVLSLNHVDFWRDHLGREIGDYSRHVRQLQKMIVEGTIAPGRTFDYWREHVTMKVVPRNHQPERYPSFNGYTNSFQPIGDLVVEFAGPHEFRDYSRVLDIENGLVLISYRVPDAGIVQEAFISLNYDVLVLRIRSSRPFTGRIVFHRNQQDEYHWDADWHMDLNVQMNHWPNRPPTAISPTSTPCSPATSSPSSGRPK